MANFITIFRTLLVFVVVAILYLLKTSGMAYLLAFVLSIVIISMDCLDGYIARKFNLATKFGAVLDIIGDRIVENVYWVAFLGLGWLPIWIPLVVLTRGICVDGIRSIALEQGMTAFGSSTMMKSKIGKFIVASNFSRTAYAVFKAIAFSLIILANMPGLEAGILKTTIVLIAYSCVYITVFFCVARGIPVLVESKYLFTENKLMKTDKSDVVPGNITTNQGAKLV